MDRLKLDFIKLIFLYIILMSICLIIVPFKYTCYLAILFFIYSIFLQLFWNKHFMKKNKKINNA